MPSPFELKKDASVIAYLASKIENLSHLKLFKLLFIIDELSMKEEGVKITSFNYEAWKLGPVPRRLWNEMKYGNMPDLYKDAFELLDGKHIEIKALSTSDDYLSEYELGIIDQVVSRYGQLDGNELIAFLHRRNSLWSMFYDPDIDGVCENEINLNEAISDISVKEEIALRMAYLGSLGTAHA